jgi:hypothetical protein
MGVRLPVPRNYNRPRIRTKNMTTMKQGLIGAVALLLLFAAATPTFGQTNNLDFNGVSATVEGAIRLSWNSTSNEVYEIDYADSLIDTNTGTITWNTLYTDYPSHGTNTFIADAGNYDTTPEIPHPKYSPMRFYRIVHSDNSTSPTNPVVTISSVTNGASLSGDVVVTVSASSSEILSEVKLYVDGELQRMSDDGTNFIINTCEWPNGPHVIFATAKSQSVMENLPFANGITFGRSVSPYVNATFNNLITRFDFSEPFFEPSEGQTQRVTAVFAANVNWTLEIQDVNTNDVIYASGSGTSMEYDWDGNGTNGITIPDGLYTYLLTVQTNGQSFSSMSSSMSEASLSASDTVDSDSTALWVQQPDGNILPFDIYPPGTDTNDFYIFEAPASWMPERVSPLQSSATLGIESNASEASAAYSGPSSQSSRAPKRKPKSPVKNKSGTFGICYKTCPVGFSAQEPRTGRIPPLQPVFVAIDTFPSQSAPLPWGTSTTSKPMADGLAQGLKIGGFKQKFLLADDKWSAADIKKPGLGGSSIFNTCNFGWLDTHGCYGTIAEIDGVKYTYLMLFDSVHGPEYVRLSDMDLGSSDLRWMTIFSCDSLHPANVTSMANNFKMPDNDNLHLLLGATTATYGTPLFGITYASNLVFQVSIKNSFINAGQQVYANAARDPVARASMTNSVTFRVRGWNSCMNDTLYLWNFPDLNDFQSVDTTVYTP